MKNSFFFPYDIDGYLWPAEGIALYNLARINKDLGAIVELGGFVGRSAVCLAQGSKNINGGKVYSIDVFEERDTDVQNNFLPVFKNNIKKYHLEKYIEPVKGSFRDIAKDWNKPIRLLFIDGEHSEKELKKDFILWERSVSPGGIIVFHDSLISPGLTKIISEIISSGKFKNIHTLDSNGSITHMTKLQENEILEEPEIKFYIDEFKLLAENKVAAS